MAGREAVGAEEAGEVVEGVPIAGASLGVPDACVTGISANANTSDAETPLGAARFDVRALPPVVVVSGHYGAGKTNLALNLAFDAVAAGVQVALADLDVVNPYFRSSDYAAVLSQAGIELIAPAFAGTTLDSPGISGKVATAVQWAREGVAGETAVEGELANEAGESAALTAVRPTGSAKPAGPAKAAGSARRLLIIDAGGDDVGATALGRFARVVAEGPYAMLHVVNRSRNLTATPQEALAILREVETASRLRVTAIANNTHLADQTTPEVLARGAQFARAVADFAGVPLAFSTVEHSLEKAASDLGVVYPVRILVRKPWE